MVASDISEVTGTAFIKLSGLMHAKMNKLKGSLKALQILSGLSIFAFWRLPAEVKMNALEHVQWVFDDWQLTGQPLPVYKNFYGPKAELDNVQLLEFYCSELFYSQHLAGEDAALDKLIAVLYRKGKPFYNSQKDIDGDIRQPFNDNLVQYNSTIIKKWPAAVKQAILIFYEGCREKIAADNAKVFSGTGGGDTGSGDADLFAVLRGLSGGKYGNLKEVEKLNLHTALREMNILIEEQERMEAELNK